MGRPHMAAPVNRRPEDSATGTSASDESTIRVSAAHGDIGSAQHAVMVGHYVGSTIDGAERAVDLATNGRLAQRELLGVYPGPIGTAEVIGAPVESELFSVVVIGMGETGTLATANLTAGVARGHSGRR